MDLEQKDKDRAKEIKIVVLGKGLNREKTMSIDVTQTNVIKIGEHSYNLKPDAFFLEKRRLRKDKYTIVFREGKTEPVRVEKPESNLTSPMLKIIRESPAAERALRELFTAPFSLGGRKMLFLGIVIVVAGLAFLVMTGQFDLGRILA